MKFERLDAARKAHVAAGHADVLVAYYNSFVDVVPTEVLDMLGTRAEKDLILEAAGRGGVPRTMFGLFDAHPHTLRSYRATGVYVCMLFSAAVCA